MFTEERVLQAISEKLTPAIVSMGSIRDPGTRHASFRPHRAGDGAFTERLAETLADHDDALLAAYLADDAAVSYGELRRELAAQTRQVLLHPVFFGSAVTGTGVTALTEGITELLPAAEGNAQCPVSGIVFKVERGNAGEKIAYARMFSGTVRVRDRLQCGQESAGKVTAISTFSNGPGVARDSVAAGQIAKLWGLGDVRIGDTLGVPDAAPVRRHFAPPTLETVVVPRREADRGTLHDALAQLAEQDPLINLRQDDIRQELLVSLYGEVQKEVIQATLAEDFGLDVGFRETTTICIERPDGTGAAVEFMGGDNPFRATVGLRIDPVAGGSAAGGSATGGSATGGSATGGSAAADTGVAFRLEIEHGALPSSFLGAVEESVRATLRQGLYGWEVTDATVTMTHSGYTPPPPFGWSKWSSSAGDFRSLTPLVLMSALRRAGTLVHEPMHRFRLEVPADTVGPIAPVLGRLRGVPGAPAMRGSSCVLEGEIPAARLHELQQQLPALTRGEGVLESAFERYKPVRGSIPARPRSDDNPLNRKEYLLRVARGVAGR